MDSNIKSLNAIKLLDAEEAIERILSGLQSQKLKMELKKWYSFGLSKEGQGLIDLSSEELGSFMDKLSDITLVLYNYHHK